MVFLNFVLYLFITRAVHAVGPVSFSVSDYRDIDTVVTRSTHNNKSCNSFSARISMIEHFFTLIYNEFEGSPPSCVCVQMCDSQPIFCYPNGCLRRDPTYSGNNIRLKFDIATFPPTQVDEKAENKFGESNNYKYPNKFENRFQHTFNEKHHNEFDEKPVAVIDNNVNKNIIVKPVGNEQLLPLDLKFFDNKFKSLVKFPRTKSIDIPKNDRYTLIRTDAAGKFLTEEEYQAAEDQFRRHLHVSP